MRYPKYIFLVFCLVGCKKEPKKEAVSHTYTIDYSLSYDATTNKTAASVNVRTVADDDESNAMNTLPGDESLFFGDQRLEFDGTSFKIEMNGKIQSGSFTFVDENETKYINQAVLPKPIAQPDMDTIRREYNYVWIGEPVATNEAVNLRLFFPPYTSPTHVRTVVLDHPTTTAGDTEIGQLQFLGNVNQLNDFVLSRRLTLNAEQPTNGGSRIVSIYLAEQRRAFLKD